MGRGKANDDTRIMDVHDASFRSGNYRMQTSF